MKKPNKLPACFIALFIFAACNDGDHIKLGDESDIVKPVFEQNALQNFVIDDKTDMSEKIGTWSWTRTDYNIQAAPVYAIEVADNSSFENTRDLITSYSNNVEITYKTVNDAALLFVKESRQITLFFRLRTGLNTVGTGPVFYSGAKSVTFACYVAFPKELYMVGADFGGWDWNSDGVVSLAPIQNNNPEDGAFWCVRYLAAGKGFKWSQDKTWDTAFGKMDTNIGFSNDEEGNASVSADGLYAVFVNYPDKTIAIEPAKVYGIGDAFGGWDTGKYPFTIAGNKAAIVTTAASNLRMYATSGAMDAYNSDWWRHEFNISGGKIVYRGTGEELDAVPVAAGKTVTLYFNAGTGTIE
ncbi:MAG: SusF/SusE family outer membrane protein [Prevotella sp.]|jgi:hypothetical protein|nr:SusF/SusE family outer membrane protein [Prevotella sp.]